MMMNSSEIDHIAIFNTLVGILSLFFGAYSAIDIYQKKKLSKGFYSGIVSEHIQSLKKNQGFSF